MSDSQQIAKHCGLYRVPRGWRIVPLGQLAQTQYGISATPSDNGTVPMLAMKDLNGGRVSFNDVPYIDIDKDTLETYRLNDGDILFNRTNSADLVGKTGMFWECPGQDYVFASYLVRVSVNRQRAHPAFVCLFMNSHAGVHRLRALATPGVSQYNINPTNLRRAFYVPLPPLAEQEHIVEILSTWDRAIERTEKLIEAKRRLKQGLMQQLLTGKRRFPNFAGQPCREHRLRELFTERVETQRPDLPLLAITADRGVIDRDEINRKDSSNSDKSKYKRIAPGDIGYNTMRMWQGVSALSSLEGIVSPAYTLCVPGPRVDAHFAKHLFKYPPVVDRFYRYSQGLTSDTWNLKFHHFAEVKVTIPEVAEQKRIASTLDTIDREIVALSRLVDHFKQQKRGVMQKLLTGRIRVKV